MRKSVDAVKLSVFAESEPFVADRSLKRLLSLRASLAGGGGGQWIFGCSDLGDHSSSELMAVADEKNSYLFIQHINVLTYHFDVDCTT